jgi:hypothetical protein
MCLMAGIWRCLLIGSWGKGNSIAIHFPCWLHSVPNLSAVGRHGWWPILWIWRKFSVSCYRNSLSCSLGTILHYAGNVRWGRQCLLSGHVLKTAGSFVDFILLRCGLYAIAFLQFIPPSTFSTVSVLSTICNRLGLATSEVHSLLRS